MLKKINLIIVNIVLLFVILFLLIFIFTNTDIINLNLIPFGYKIQIRTYLLVLISIFLGYLISIISKFFDFGKIFKNFKDNNKIKKMENEINNLKDKINDKK